MSLQEGANDFSHKIVLRSPKNKNVFFWHYWPDKHQGIDMIPWCFFLFVKSLQAGIIFAFFTEDHPQKCRVFLHIAKEVLL